MANDPFAQFKSLQRESWGLFVPVEGFTTAPAGQLVSFAQVQAGEKVLDVACGTGVVSVTAARRGAKVSGLDLSPQLLERAHWNANLAAVEISFTEGDAEALPYRDGEFDVVLSQFGHMFAPRPEIVIGEMLRVLRPGGRIAFSTWPPELFTGKMFALTASYMPPPEGVAPPPQWGNPQMVRERLGDGVKDIFFERELAVFPSLSPQHMRNFFEATVGPLSKLAQSLKDNPARLQQYRLELEGLISEYFTDNVVRQHYLMTRAKKI
jgi:SAM-dependent methyltransferase